LMRIESKNFDESIAMARLTLRHAGGFKT